MEDRNYSSECECDKLQVTPIEQAKLENSDAFLHQASCVSYVPGTVSADEMRKRLNGVELFLHSDLVLQLLPAKDMLHKPKVLGVGSMSDGMPNYIINWVYKGVTLRLERAIFKHPEYGNVSMYAVQRIYSNEEKSTKPVRSGGSARKRANKRARDSRNRRK